MLRLISLLPAVFLLACSESPLPIGLGEAAKQQAIAFHRRASAALLADPSKASPKESYFLGLHAALVAGDRDAAFRLLGAAGDAGVAEASFAYARLLIGGSGADLAPAIGRLHRAASQGLAAAQLDLGIMIAAGRVGGCPPDTGLVWIREAVRGGSRQAVTALVRTAARYSRILLTDDPVFAAVVQLAREGDADAAYLVGMAHAQSGNRAKAAPYLARASATGHAASLYQSVVLGLVPESERAVTLRKAAEAGSPRAQLELFRRMADETGDSGDAELELGYDWLQRAHEGFVALASTQDPETLYLCGHTLALLEAEPSAEMRSWLERSAMQGFGPAMVALSLLQIESEDPHARVRGVEMLRLAANRGFAPAMLELGRLLVLGQGTTPDLEAEGLLALHRAQAEGIDEAGEILQDLRAPRPGHVAPAQVAHDNSSPGTKQMIR